MPPQLKCFLLPITPSWGPPCHPPPPLTQFYTFGWLAPSGSWHSCWNQGVQVWIVHLLCALAPFALAFRFPCTVPEGRARVTVTLVAGGTGA